LHPARRRRRLQNPNRTAARESSSAALSSSWRSPGVAQVGEKDCGAFGTRARAPHRPRALTVVRHQVQSASPSGSPPPSPARPPKCHRLTPRVARFAPVKTSSQPVPHSPRLSRLAGVVYAPLLAGGFPSPVRHRTAARVHKRLIWIERSRSIPTRGQTI
jgi:hypothetical protein